MLDQMYTALPATADTATLDQYNYDFFGLFDLQQADLPAVGFNLNSWKNLQKNLRKNLQENLQNNRGHMKRVTRWSLCICCLLRHLPTGCCRRLIDGATHLSQHQRIRASLGVRLLFARRSSTTRSPSLASSTGRWPTTRTPT